MSRKQDPPISVWTRLKWAAIIFFVSADMASIIAIGPSLAFFYNDILTRTTDCGQIGDCDARAAKYSGVSGSINSFLVVVLAAPYGIAADTYGRRPLLIAASFRLLMTYPFLLGTPSSIIPYFVMNALAGLMPVAPNIINMLIVDLSSPSDRLQMLSLMQLATLTIAMIATFSGSLLVGIMGPQALLKISIVMTIIEVIVLFSLLPETSHLQKSISEQREEETQGPSSSGASGQPRMRRMTSKNMADVLFRGKDIDDDHRWECKAFWLYLLCELPDSMVMSVLPFFIHLLYQFTPAEFGALMSLAMIYQFVWLSAGINLLNYIFSEDTRTFQALICISVFGDLIVDSGAWHLGPFIATFFAAATSLVPLTLKAIILNATAEHRQGKVMGFINATESLCNVVGPTAGGFLLTFATDFGFPRSPWIVMTLFLKPFAIATASTTMLPECMPPALKKRVVAGKQWARMKSSSSESFMLGL